MCVASFLVVVVVVVALLVVVVVAVLVVVVVAVGVVVVVVAVLVVVVVVAVVVVVVVVVDDGASHHPSILYIYPAYDLDTMPKSQCPWCPRPAIPHPKQFKPSPGASNGTAMLWATPMEFHGIPTKSLDHWVTLLR